MKRLKLTFSLLLLLCAGLNLNSAGQAPATQNLLIGTWSRIAHSGGESKHLALRFELDKNDSTVMFIDLPDLKFHNFGPIPVVLKADEYKGAVFSFQLAADKKHIKGVWSFNGNETNFELEPGSLPPQPAARLE